MIIPPAPRCWVLVLAPLLCLSAVAAGWAAEREPAAAVRLRVLTYNIHHGAGVDGKLDLQRIAAVIKSTRPDLVAVQEVDQGVRRSKKQDQPALLGKLTGMHVVFGDNIRFGGGKYGNAVLSRFPIAKKINHRLPNRDQGEQRGVLEVHVRPPGLKQPLVFLATHLDHRRADEERLESARAINQLILKQPRHPALLAGDLNDVINSRTLRAFDSTWRRANRQPQPTVPVSKPNRQIDFILVHPASRWTAVEFQVLPEAIASDHRAVFAVLEFQPE